jgi:hypothetical protein
MSNGPERGGQAPDPGSTPGRKQLPRRTLWQSWPEALLLVGVALLVYGMLLRPGHAPYSPVSDLIPYGLPTKQVLYDSLQAGRGLPVWRSDQLSGSVAATQPQSLYTYPLDFLYWILAPISAAGPSMWLHLLVAGLGCLAWGRQLGLGQSGRVVMGIAGLVSFKLMLTVYAGWTPVLPSLSLLPWIAAALCGFVARPTSTRTLLLAGAVAMALLAGSLQYSYYLALLFAPWLSWQIVGLAREGKAPEVRRLLLGGLGALVLGFMIAAHLWLPVLSDVNLLTRGNLEYSFFLGEQPLDVSDLITLIAPEALGTPLDGIMRTKVRLWEDVMYFGWLPLGLALLAGLTSFTKPVVRWLVFGALASMLLAFDTPLLRAMFDWFPGYALFRLPARMLFLTGFALIALAGFGADWLDARLRARSARAALVAVGTIVALMTIEGAIRARQYLEVRPHEEFRLKSPVLEELASDSGPYRVVQLGGRPPNFSPILASATAPDTAPGSPPGSTGLEFVDGYDPYAFAHYRRYLDGLGTLQRPSPYSQMYLMSVRRWDMLSALNVRYLLSAREAGAPAGWTLIRRWPQHPAYHFGRGIGTQPLWLYERTDPLARAFLAERIVPVPDSEKAWQAIQNRNLNRAAVIETEAGVTLTNAASPGDTLVVVDAQPGELLLRSQTSSTRFAVVSEVWHPGWRASLDGSAVPLHRTNGTLLGLSIPPGSHEISLRFTPSHWTLGWALGGVGLALVAAANLRALLVRNGGLPRDSGTTARPVAR